MITLPENRAVPLYQALYSQFKQQIQSGAISPGTKLPSKRKLAEQLGVSINTVDSAYCQLEAEGFIQSFPRRGFFVLETGLMPQSPPSPAPQPQPSLPKAAPSYQVDFSPSGMARDQFPFGVWRRLMKNCWSEYDENLLLRTPPQGDLGLRQAVGDYLYRARGVVCTPDQIIIGAGTDNLLFILSYILSGSFTLAVENPLYNEAHRLFSRMGHRVSPVPVGPDGIQISELPQEDQVLVYTTPSHQYPLGYAMPIGQRTALLRWSMEGQSRYIIEDDYDSEFRYQSRPIPSLQSIDHQGRVIYLGTFSRSVAPGLRISYMVLPQQLISLYRDNYSGFSSTVSGFEQAVLREFMRGGHFDTHVSRMRVYYRNRRQCLLDALSPLRDQLDILGAPAGHHLTLNVKNGMTEQELVASAEKRAIRVYPVSPYFLGNVPERCKSTILLGFGGLTDQAIKVGAAALVSAWG